VGLTQGSPLQFNLVASHATLQERNMANMEKDEQGGREQPRGGQGGLKIV